MGWPLISMEILNLSQNQMSQKTYFGRCLLPFYEKCNHQILIWVFNLFRRYAAFFQQKKFNLLRAIGLNYR